MTLRSRTSGWISALTLLAGVVVLAPGHAADAATPSAVIDGSARFEVLSPTLVRVEYAADGRFEDRPTFNAVDRAMQDTDYTTTVQNGVRVIRTPKLTLRYVQGSGPFTQQNLAVDLVAGGTAVTARPSWPTVPLCAYGAGCEAENLGLTGGAALATDHANYTGAGFVAGFTGAGAQISWSTTGIPAAGDYAVSFRYANSTGGDGQNTTRTVSLTANGTTSRVSLPTTANWDTWAVASTTVHLAAGTDPVSIACGTGDSCNVNVDSIAVTAVGAGYPTPPTAPPSAALGGWRRSLDGQSGPAPTADGLLSRDGWHLVDDSQTALLNADQTITQRPSRSGPYQDGYFFGYGHDYRQGLRDLHDLTGPAVLLPEWAFGVWYSRYFPYTTTDYQNTLLPAFRSHQTPLDTLVVDTDFKSPNTWDGWEWNPALFPDPQAFLNWTKQQGLQVSLNVHSSIAENDTQYAAAQATSGGALAAGNCVGDVGTNHCHVFDWSDPAQLKAYFDLHKPFENQGVRQWWLDWCCDSSHVSASGVTPDTWINSQYTKETDARGLRGFAFSRIGSGLQSYSGSSSFPSGPWAEHRYSLHFTGDTTSNWNVLGFEPSFTTGEGAIGLPYVSHDIGGFNGQHPADDLYARWVQFGAFQPVLRLHSNHGDRLPWDYGQAAEASAEKFLRLRESLVPYTYSLAKQSRDTGLPMARAMYLNYPEYSEAYSAAQQYLYGDDVLVAPVTTPGTSGVQTSVWFPPGTWTDYFTGRSYTGPSTQTVTTDLSTMPVFVRSGGIVPTRTDYVDHTTQSPLTQVTLDVAAGGNGSSTLYEDAGEGNAYQAGQSATTGLAYAESAGTRQLSIDAMHGTYAGAVSARTWTARFRNAAPPSTVTVNGAATPDWTYDAATRVLTVRTTALPTRQATTIAYTPSATATGPITGIGGKCVDVAGGNSADTTAVQLYTCNGTPAQQWTTTGDGTLRALGKCMDVTNGSSASGTQVQLYSCNGTNAQQWSAQPDGTLRAYGKCLDASGGSSADGTRLIIWDCTGNSNQQWQLPT
ncbi:DUF5110 domain-containing protein [Solihabitans fulvus]|uniref:DUF5110 domain-containing protein n=1 Tax=Solihabitans fulvus TaxID=1892852 RepID=A0A5B2WYV2_9PSEU|nr:TIM-barrel domain-containing protein [Solihabitans fulvus]KAA2256090.1 DUF5110 domain-containing protein [Solihabitans fulvus]